MKNRSRGFDQVPVFVKSDRNHRLNVKDPLCSAVGTDTEIEIVLEWDADEVGDGILGFLGQFLGLGLLLAARFGSV